jgi:pimeloyl-ACP methyl ester carboxylesterase
VIEGLRLADDRFLTRIYTESYALAKDLNSACKVYSKPTLIALGRQDSSVGYRDAWSIIELFPRGTFVVLDKAGHNLQIEQETLFNALVNEWLDRVEETIESHDD